MKKKCLALICLLLFALSAALPVFAGGTPRLVDQADYLSDSEEAELLAKLDEISTRQGLDVVIVTTPELYGKTETEFADDYYDENGFHPDGILLLIADYERTWAISTAGYGITVFTDVGQEYMTSIFVEHLSDGNFALAFDSYADLCDAFITQAKTGSPYDVDNLPQEPFMPTETLIISLVVGFVVALIVTGSMKRKLRSVHSQPAASQYIVPGSLDITQSREIYLYSQVRRTERKQEESGGSSTHTSSSGRTHGGSSGKF